MIKRRSGGGFRELVLDGCGNGKSLTPQPHLEQQNVTIAGVNFGTIPGINFRVLTWAPVNIIMRYQAGDFEPYGAWGLECSFLVYPRRIFQVRALMWALTRKSGEDCD